MTGQDPISLVTRRLLASAGVNLSEGVGWDEVAAALDRAGVDVRNRLAVRIELDRLGILRPMGTGGEFRIDPQRVAQLLADASLRAAYPNPQDQLSGQTKFLLGQAGIQAPYTNYSHAAISRKLEEAGVGIIERMAVKAEMARARLMQS